MANVELQGVTKFYGSTRVIPGLDLQISSGEFVALVGPSGCGKSTILRMIAGLEDPTSGVLKIQGRVVNVLSPQERGIAMVFQNYALYPHMSVRQNMEFSLKLAGLGASERSRRLGEATEMLGLAELLERKPSQLSGGQKQRVAMGRALVRRPQVLLLDEPLSNLDAQLRNKVRAEIAQIHKKFKSTIIYVTHDQVEAMSLADRIVVLNRGRLEQVGAPLEVYHQPATEFVAGFIGSPPMNFISTHLLPDHWNPKSTPGGAGRSGVRPENTLLSRKGQLGHGVKLGSGKISLIEPLGATHYLHVRTEGDSGSMVVESRKVESFRIDDEVELWCEPSHLFHFSSDGRRLSE